jgi:hypothetical protein
MENGRLRRHDPHIRRNADAVIPGPMAIRHAVTISAALGWMLTITLCFCINPVEAGVKSPTGLPAAQIFVGAGGRRGRTLMFFAPLFLFGYLLVVQRCWLMRGFHMLLQEMELCRLLRIVLSLPICLIILIDDLASGITSTQPHKPPWALERSLVDRSLLHLSQPDWNRFHPH